MDYFLEEGGDGKKNKFWWGDAYVTIVAFHHQWLGSEIMEWTTFLHCYYTYRKMIAVKTVFLIFSWGKSKFGRQLPVDTCLLHLRVRDPGSRNHRKKNSEWQTGNGRTKFMRERSTIKYLYLLWKSYTRYIKNITKEIVQTKTKQTYAAAG